MAITPNVLDTIAPLNASATSYTLDASGATEGQRMFAAFSFDDSGDPTPPTGWSLVQDANTSSSGSTRARAALFTRVATASESAAYEWTFSAGVKASVVLFEVNSEDTTIDASGKAEASLVLEQTLGSITVSTNGSAILVIGAVSTDQSPPDPITPPTGYTSFSEIRSPSQSISRSSVNVCTRDFTSEGSTGSVVVNTDPDRCVAIIVSIRAGLVEILPASDKSGHYIDVTSTSTTPANYAVKINGGSAITPTAARLKVGGTHARLTLPNGTRILSGDTFTVSSTADGVTDEEGTNNSIQTSTTIKMPTINGGNVSLDFASAPTVGVTVAGVIQYTNAASITGRTHTLGTNEEQYRCDVQLDPSWGDSSFNDAAVSFPYTPAADESLVARVWLPTLSTHAVSTEFDVGDVIQEGNEYYRVTTAGTTAGTKPTFSKAASPITDGSVTWTVLVRPNGDDNRSVVQHTVYAVCAGATLKPQTNFAPSYMAGADKTWHDTSDINKSLLPGDTINGVDVSTAEGQVEYPWYDMAATSATYRIPGMQYPTYGQSISEGWQSVVAAAFSDALYTDTLIERMVQRGIEQKGIREVGGVWLADGGHAQGRISMAIFAGGILEQGDAWFDDLKQNANATTDWRGTEFAAQVSHLTQTQIETVLNGEFQYSTTAAAGVGKTFLDPTSTPSTIGTGDAPAVAYHPASVRGSWLHVPEFGIRSETTFARSTPLWSYHDDEPTQYRRCCTAREWSYLCYMIDSLEITDTMNAPVFFDYVRRYQYIQGPENADAFWDRQDLWTLFESAEPAFAYTATAVNVAGTWYIDLNFNRYATQTNANILDQFACSGSVTLSNADQTGPRTFRVQASADPRGQTITYTQSGTAANRVVDAGNNQLPTGSTAAMNIVVSGTGQVQTDGTIRMNFTRLSGLWGSTITPDNTKITAISQVTGGTRTFTVGSVSGAGTGTLQVIITPTPLIYSTASGGAVTVTIGEGWLTDENGNTTAAFSGIDDVDNSSTQTPPVLRLTRGRGGGSVSSKSTVRVINR